MKDEAALGSDSSFILHNSSLLLRDGVTGNTLRFERRD
jgi:hypothetical protein